MSDWENYDNDWRFFLDEEEPFLWKHWFDVTYEKITIARAVTELAYQ